MSTTPFGRPLVPLEYGISAGSPGCTCGRGAGPVAWSSDSSKRSISSEAPESASWRATSSSVADGPMPVTAPPAVIAASATPAHGAMFGALMASTSPGPEAAGGEQRGDALDAAGELSVGQAVDRDPVRLSRRDGGDQLVEGGATGLDRLVRTRV